MIMMGGWWLISGIAAIFENAFYAVTPNWILKFDVSTWSWVHLIIGIIVLVAGFGLSSAKPWARTVGVITAVIASLVSFAWLPYYPVWAVIYIAVSVAIIWALTMHGHDITDA